MKKILISIVGIFVATTSFAATDYNSSRSNKNGNSIAVDVSVNSSTEAQSDQVNEGGSSAVNSETKGGIKIEGIQGEMADSVFIKFDGVEGESQDKSSIKIEGIEGEMNVEAFMKIDDIKGESQDSAAAGSKKGYDYYQTAAANTSAQSGVNWTITTGNDADFVTQNSVAVQSTQQVKLFGFIGMDMKINAQMNAEGEISEMKKPWYAIFAW